MRPQPLRPQWRSRSWPPLGEEERPPRRFAKAAREKRGTRQALDNELFDLVGVREDFTFAGELVGVGEAEGDAVVGPKGLNLLAKATAEARLKRERPRRVDAGAERGEEANAPVAELVAKSLDDKRFVGGEDAGRLALLANIAPKVGGGVGVETVVGAEVALLGGGLHSADLADEGAECAAEFDGSPRSIAAPKGHLARLAGCRGDDDPIAGDLLDAPGRSAEEKGLAAACLVDHLLVEFADARTALAEVDREEAPVGNGPRVAEGDHFGAAPRAKDVGASIPREERPELGELARGIASREHLEGLEEELAAEVAKAVGSADERLELIDGPRRDRAVGNELLREDIEAGARHVEGLDSALDHPPRHDRRLEEVAAKFGNNAAATRLADAVPGAANSLQTARNGPR